MMHRVRRKTVAHFTRQAVKIADHGFGHNPMGTLSVIAILAALFVQVGTGLFAVDVDGLESGPLATLVSFEAGRQAAEIHEVSFNILLGLIGLHVAAIVTYLIFFLAFGVLAIALVKPDGLICLEC